MTNQLSKPHPRFSPLIRTQRRKRERERERERESIKNNFYFWFMLIGYLEASVMESNIRSVIIWDIILKSMDECTN